jgi:nitrate/nitrite transporter NarK
VRRLVALFVLALVACEKLDDTFQTARGKIRNAVREELKDPDSAQFKDLSQCAGNKEVWTGRVNSKNTFGAYVGFESFLARQATAVFWSHPMYDDLLKECYKGDPVLKEMLRNMPSDLERIQR